MKILFIHENEQWFIQAEEGVWVSHCIERYLVNILFKQISRCWNDIMLTQLIKSFLIMSDDFIFAHILIDYFRLMDLFLLDSRLKSVCSIMTAWHFEIGGVLLFHNNYNSCPDFN